MIPFIDLNAQQKLIRDKINKRINQVLDHGQYILGPEVKELKIDLVHLQALSMFYVALVELMHCYYLCLA